MHIVFLKSLLPRDDSCPRAHCSKVLTGATCRSGLFRAKWNLQLLFACDMAFSWFAEHKLPCNCFAVLLEDAISAVGAGCPVLSVLLFAQLINVRWRSVNNFTVD